MTTVDRMDERFYATRTPAALENDRQRGIAAWQAAAELLERNERGRRENRQAGTEARRRLAALQRVNQALAERAELAARASFGDSDKVPARAVVVHRLEWMRERLATGLSDHGIVVVAAEHDGADGLGVSIAEQPELLVVEDRLASVRAVELVSRLRELAPATVVAAQVENVDELDDLLAAGAVAVFGRRVPPADICAQLAAYLRERPDAPLVVA